MGPNQCSCREGYVGPNCELDLDECATGVHQCHDTSVCVNMPGWYYCKCKPGYRTIFHHNTLGTLCQGKFLSSHIILNLNFYDLTNYIN